MRGRGFWECLTRSRMATLAVNALLLSGELPGCHTTTVASAGAGWSDARSSMFRALSAAPAASRSRHSTVIAASATAKNAGKLFGRHSDGERGVQTCKEYKRLFTREHRRRTQVKDVSAGASAARNMRRRRLFAGVYGGEQQQRVRVGGLRNELCVRSAGADTGEEEAGSKEVAGGRSAGLIVKGVQSGVSASSAEMAVCPHQKGRHRPVPTRMAAIFNTVMRTPRAATAAAPVAAAAAAVAAAASQPPLPSYLRWPSNSNKKAAESKVSVNSGGGGGGGCGGRRNRSRKMLSLGIGSCVRRPGSSDKAPAMPSNEEGSLKAAKSSRGGGGAAGAVSLSFTEAMFAGAVSKSIAQTCMQPANVVKTLLQGRGTSSQLSNLSFKLLTRGAGAQFIMSLPHGAFNYATLEVILGCTSKIFPDEWRERAGPVLDFLSSSVATLVCSVVSTPQMVITDRIMAGMYPNLVSGMREISRSEGLPGFYTGWTANVTQKIPSYGLTWVFFQQFKRFHRQATDRSPTNTENFVLGAAAAGATVCIMIPFDTVKTRLVTQTAQAGVVPYKGVYQTLTRIVQEEGVGPLYRSLTPRLVSVVPMIGIQFGIYEFVRKELMSRKDDGHEPRSWLPSAVRRTLRMGRGSMQPDYFKDFLKNVYLMEEKLV